MLLSDPLRDLQPDTSDGSASAAAATANAAARYAAFILTTPPGAATSPAALEAHRVALLATLGRYGAVCDIQLYGAVPAFAGAVGAAAGQPQQPVAGRPVLAASQPFVAAIAQLRSSEAFAIAAVVEFQWASDAAQAVWDLDGSSSTHPTTGARYGVHTSALRVV
jgi:hypothetical protein